MSETVDEAIALPGNRPCRPGRDLAEIHLTGTPAQGALQTNLTDQISDYVPNRSIHFLFEKSFQKSGCHVILQADACGPEEGM